MGMEEYPQNVMEFEKQFNSEESCREYLFQIRWPNGFKCQHCQHNETWSIDGGLYKCKNCGFKTSVIAGTIFQDSKKPLKVWFHAIWHLTSQKYGVNALGLQRVLGFGSYHTAWTWLYKLRRAMVRPGRDRLSGVVDIDEAYIGGKRPGKRGRGAEGKALIFVAVESKDNKIGRVRLKRIPNASAGSLEPSIRETVEPGTIINTDDWRGYSGVSQFGYTHKIVRKNPEIGVNLLPRVNRVVSLLKRWLLRIYQGRVQPPFLDYYLDEFTFRFNRRTSGSRGKLFYRLVQQAVAIEPMIVKCIHSQIVDS